MNRLLFVLVFLVTSAHINAQTDANAPHTLQQVMELGRGTANTVDWNSTWDVIAVGGSRGLWLYDNSLADLAHFEEVGAIIRVSWSPVGSQLATFTVDGALQTWSVGLEPYTLTLDRTWSYPVTGAYPLIELVWAPDGERLAFLSETGAQILDAVTGDTLVAIPDLINTLTWHPDGTQIAGVVGMGDDLGEQVRVWNASNGDIVHTYTTADTSFYWSAVQWSPDGAILVGVTSLPATFHAWDVATGELLNDPDPTAGEMGAYSDMWWIDNGQQVVTVSRSVSQSSYVYVELWDTTTWIHDLQVLSFGDIRAIAKRPNANDWVLLTWDGQLVIWGLEAAEPLQSRFLYSQPAYLLAWSPDNHHLAVSNPYSEPIFIWDMTAAAPSQPHIVLNPYRGWKFNELRWNPSSDRLRGFLAIDQITAPGAFPIGFILEWDVHTEESIGTLHETPGYVAWDGSGSYLPREVWSEDFSRVATVMNDTALITIAPVVRDEYGVNASEEVLATIELSGSPSQMVWSPDSTLLAVVTVDQTREETSAWIYHAETGALINRLRPSFQTTLYDLSWSPDSTMVALVGRSSIGGSDETEYRLDIVQMDRRAAEAAHFMTILDQGTTFYHAWHPQSQAIAVTTSSGVALYPIQSLPMGIDAVPIAIVPDMQAFALAWSPDGAWLAGSCRDGTVRVWDVSQINE